MATKAAVLAVVRAARPRCNNPADTLAFAIHAAVLTEGYNLVAVGAAADHPTPTTTTTTDASMDATDAAATADAADPMLGWNAWWGCTRFNPV
jgi:proteasome inhibitor subunit 1 (PI31)